MDVTITLLKNIIEVYTEPGYVISVRAVLREQIIVLDSLIEELGN